MLKRFFFMIMLPFWLSSGGVEYACAENTASPSPEPGDSYYEDWTYQAGTRYQGESNTFEGYLNEDDGSDRRDPASLMQVEETSNIITDSDSESELAIKSPY